MELLYIANARIPTEKAHGVAIMKACQAFARARHSVRLVVARRVNALPQDAHALYGIPEQFPIVRIPTLDLYAYETVLGRACFVVQAFTFYKLLFLWVLFQSRSQVIYTRDAPVILLRLLGYRVFFECHSVPRRTPFFFALARRASGIVVISQGIRKILTSAGIDEKKIIVEPSGVDLSIFDTSLSLAEARQTLGLPQEKFILVYTGSFTTFGEDKGLTDSIRAFALLRDPNVLFLAVGGSEQDRTRYEALARELGVTDAVRLLGPVPQKELATCQKAADALLMPFPDIPHYRNHISPVKMFEYMASKRPIIATDLPTIREVLYESTAIIVPPGNPEALAAAVRKLRENSTGGKACALRAYENVRRYTWDVRMQRVAAFIQRSIL